MGATMTLPQTTLTITEARAQYDALRVRAQNLADGVRRLDDPGFGNPGDFGYRAPGGRLLALNALLTRIQRHWHTHEHPVDGGLDTESTASVYSRDFEWRGVFNIATGLPRPVGAPIPSYLRAFQDAGYTQDQIDSATNLVTVSRWQNDQPDIATIWPDLETGMGNDAYQNQMLVFFDINNSLGSIQAVEQWYEPGLPRGGRSRGWRRWAWRWLAVPFLPSLARLSHPPCPVFRR